jgi:hypothetical protein
MMVICDLAVMPGLVPGIPTFQTLRLTIGITGTSPAMTSEGNPHD